MPLKRYKIIRYYKTNIAELKNNEQKEEGDMPLKFNILWWVMSPQLRFNVLQ